MPQSGSPEKARKANPQVARASTITGRPMNTNGWTFWQYDDEGVTRDLEFAR